MFFCGKRDNSNINIDIYFSIIQLKWICINKCDPDTHPKPYIFIIRVTRQIKCIIAQAPGVISHPLPEVNFLMVEIPTPKPYIFMIRVTRQMKCLIAHAPGVIPHPLPEVNFLMVEIPSPKPYIFMIRVNRQMKCSKSWGLRSSPSPTGSFFDSRV